MNLKMQNLNVSEKSNQQLLAEAHDEIKTLKIMCSQLKAFANAESARTVQLEKLLDYEKKLKHK